MKNSSSSKKLVKTTNRLLSFISWSAAHLAWLTMAFSPVALGKETENISKMQLQEYVKEFGLDKKTTVGEFWQKSKAYFPGYVYKDLENFATENKNMRMPEITVTTAKATDGTEIPVVRISLNGKTNTIQFYGEKNRWIKFNNVVLSENDLISVSDAFKRVEASDINLRKEADKYRQNLQLKNSKKEAETNKQNEKMIKDFARFKGFPRMTPQQWKAMTPVKRAGYIVNMRLLWQDARQVLLVDELNQQKINKEKKFSSIEEFYKLFFEDSATAAGNTKATPQPKLSAQGKSVVATEASTPEDPQSKKCIVAGYASIEGTGTNYRNSKSHICSEALVFQSEKYNRDTPVMETVRKAQIDCRSTDENLASCNPLIYGYKKDGSTICVDRRQSLPSSPPPNNYQKATWWSGPCDSVNQLTSKQVTADGMKATDKSYTEDQKRYDESGNLKADVAQNQINLIEDDQFKNDSYKKTKSFLDSVIENKKKADSKIDFTMDDLIQGKKPWSKNIDDMLLDIQTAFEVEIGEAMQSCEKSIERKDNVDKNQKGACDQLHHRWLFTERFLSEFRAKSCLGGSTYIWKLDEAKMSKDQVDLARKNKEKIKNQDELMCQCQGSETKVKFNDDKGCGGAVVAPADDSLLKCPEGMNTINTVPDTQSKAKSERFCTCPGSTENIAINTALDRASLEGVDKICKQENACGKPAGIDNYDYVKCECKEGDLKDDNEQGVISKIFNGKQNREPRWICKKTNWLPWALGGLGLLTAIGAYLYHKKKDKSPPVAKCTLQCSGNTSKNSASCRCDPNPPTQTCVPKVGVYPNCTCPEANTCTAGQQVYNMQTCQCDNKQQSVCSDGSLAPGGNLAMCPKCSDGSYKSVPTTSRPSGCPVKNEGGSGANTCANPPCSGGVPTAH